MRLKSIAATALISGLLVAITATSPAMAAGFTDPPTVERVSSNVIADPPVGTKVTCLTAGDVFSSTCPVLDWAGLRYWFLSKTDNGWGWHVAVLGQDGVRLGDAYLGGDGRYAKSLSVDTAAQQVRVTGQGDISAEFSFTTLASIVPDESLATGVALSIPTEPITDQLSSVEVTADLDTPSLDPGGQITVETGDGTEIGRSDVPAGYTGGAIPIPIDLSPLDIGSNEITARYAPPVRSPLKASSSIGEDLQILKTYLVSFFDPEGAFIADERVVSGEAATAPSVTPPPGYLLAGWDADFSQVTADLTVHAIWQVDPAVDRIALKAFTSQGVETTAADQGGSLTLRVQAFNSAGIEIGDVTDEIALSSDVSTDVFKGSTVTFPTASPHRITAVHTASGARAELVVQVAPAEPGVRPAAPGLVQTGAPDDSSSVWFGLLLGGSGLLVLLLRRRRIR